MATVQAGPQASLCLQLDCFALKHNHFALNRIAAGWSYG
jgi:hypothetical protein